MGTYLIPGGSGLIGARLSGLLVERGERVRYLSRSPKTIDGVETFVWDVEGQTLDAAALQGVDVIVHLAGAGIMDKRLTAARKQEILASRADGLRLLRENLAKQEHTVRTLISASAQGYYEPNLDRALVEDDDVGAGWMGQLCKNWEAEALRWRELGIRVVINRIGLVLSSAGGALPVMLPPFKRGMAPHFGGGRQVFPWIHVNDMCNMIIHEVEREEVQGAYNAAAPFPATQKEFNRAIAQALGRRVVPLRAPKFMLNMFLGARSKLLVDSWRLSVEKIQKTGFTFRYPRLQDALKDLLISKD